jgi:hypothetical protein
VSLEVAIIATLFALVGLWQAVTHELFFYAPNLAVSNANSDYFRVTSLYGAAAGWRVSVFDPIAAVQEARAAHDSEPRAPPCGPVWPNARDGRARRGSLRPSRRRTPMSP